MTDKEIIKALECCKGGFCCGCPRLSNNMGTTACMRELTNQTLNLINRQQAEIERLSNSAKQWEETAKDLLIGKEKQQAEIERLTINMNAFGLGMKQEKERADTIRTEAIKEFVDLLIKRIRKNVTPIPQQMYLVKMCIQEIYNLVKEMVGEDK